jgi:hypothetical protein
MQQSRSSDRYVFGRATGNCQLGGFRHGVNRRRDLLERRRSTKRDIENFM